MSRTQTQKAATEVEHSFDPNQLISNDEFNQNLNLLIAYYQMTRGETRRRFTGSRSAA